MTLAIAITALALSVLALAAAIPCLLWIISLKYPRESIHERLARRHAKAAADAAEWQATQPEARS